MGGQGAKGGLTWEHREGIRKDTGFLLLFYLLLQGPVDNSSPSLQTPFIAHLLTCGYPQISSALHPLAPCHPAQSSEVVYLNCSNCSVVRVLPLCHERTTGLPQVPQMRNW